MSRNGAKSKESVAARDASKCLESIAEREPLYKDPPLGWVKGKERGKREEKGKERAKRSSDTERQGCPYGSLLGFSQSIATDPNYKEY